MKLFKFFKQKSKEPDYRKKHETYDRAMQTDAQGGVWISSNPNKHIIPNTAEEVDFDKLKGIKK